MSASVKFKWLDRLNQSWVEEDGLKIATLGSTQALYDKLISNEEVLIIPSQLMYMKVIEVFLDQLMVLIVQSKT